MPVTRYLLLIFIKHGNRLNMGSVGKHIDHARGSQRIAFGVHQHAGIGKARNACDTGGRMGRDEASVVDPQMRVRGVSALRIMDTSVMPFIPAGNTQAPAMALAWRAAEIIGRKE